MIQRIPFKFYIHHIDQITISIKISRLSEHMKKYGLNPRSSKDKSIYARLLVSGRVYEPRQLRGTKHDPQTGYYWSRKEAFIAKYMYGIDFFHVASILAKQQSGSDFCFLRYTHTESNLSRYLTLLPGKAKAVYVSVFNDGKGFIKIMRSVPIQYGVFLEAA